MGDDLCKTKNMKKQLNDLVELLSKEQDIECSRPKKTIDSLKQCIDCNYVHIMFKSTGTELGVQLHLPDCLVNADYQNEKGEVHLVGGLILNYDKVKCVADIDLSTCDGKGYLVPISDEEYEKIMRRTDSGNKN